MFLFILNKTQDKRRHHDEKLRDLPSKETMIPLSADDARLKCPFWE